MRPHSLTARNGSAATTAGSTRWRRNESVAGAPLPNGVLPKTGGAKPGRQFVKPTADGHGHQHESPGDAGCQGFKFRRQFLEIVAVDGLQEQGGCTIGRLILRLITVKMELHHC